MSIVSNDFLIYPSSRLLPFFFSYENGILKDNHTRWGVLKILEKRVGKAFV